MAGPTIDRDKLRSVMRRLPRGTLLILLERAVDAMTVPEIAYMIESRIGLADVIASGPELPLLEQVKRFHDSADRRDYYQPFDVNWRNSTQHSAGTDNFIAEFQRLLDLCGSASRRRPRSPTRQAFELLFDLLRQIDEGKELIFFADEGGSDEVVCYWKDTLPAYFRCLHDDAPPADFARGVEQVIQEFDRRERPFHLAAARRLARGEHRKALLAIAEEETAKPSAP